MILQTDASAVGMGAVIYQINEAGQKNVVSCASAKMTRAEQRYHCNEQEVLAVVWACRRYRALLEDRPFTLRTDSRALQWLSKFKNERAKLTRYALLLQEFKFTVEHCRGKTNQLPDFLSRHPEGNHELVEEERMLPPEETVSEPTATPSVALNQIRPKNELRQPATVQLSQVEGRNLTLYEQIAEAQRNSPEYAATRVRIQRYQDGSEPAVQPWQRTLRNDYTVQDELI